MRYNHRGWRLRRCFLVTCRDGEVCCWSNVVHIHSICMTQGSRDSYEPQMYLNI